MGKTCVAARERGMRSGGKHHGDKSPSMTGFGATDSVLPDERQKVSCHAEEERWTTALDIAMVTYWCR